MPEIHGVASWPGIVAVERWTYTCSHGITPSVILMTVQPQLAPNVAAQNGNFVFTDSVGTTITLFDCRMRKATAFKDETGDYVMLEIEDRRWRWGYGWINGVYNQLNPSGSFFAPINASAGPRVGAAKKYLPWTLQRVSDMCKILLDGMGEVGYTIVVPNDEVTPVNWDHSNPAQQLSELADGVGCRIVFDPIRNTTSVVPIGVGAALPDNFSIHKDALSLPKLGRPDSILCVGSPTRYQLRMQLEPVGEDWDGMLRPIDNLSYAPVAGRQQQEVKLTPSNVIIGKVFTVIINGITVTFTATAGTVANVTGGLSAAINQTAQLVVGARLTAVDQVVSLSVFGDVNGDGFAIQAFAQAASRLEAVLITTGKKGTWDHCVPPFFNRTNDQISPNGVHETDRLTATEALQLAQKSVFKYYRVTIIDPVSGTSALNIPGFGKIIRREQIMLQSEKVLNIIPTQQDDSFIDIFGQPLTLDFYNGYARNQPARCYGSYFWRETGVMRAGLVPYNTFPNEVVRVGFNIDAERYLVVFHDYVYRMIDVKPDPDAVGPPPLVNKVEPAKLVLETAIQLRDPVFHQIIRAEEFFIFPGPRLGSGPQVIRHPDVQINYVTLYRNSRGAPNTIAATVNDERDAKKRADFYLLLQARKWDIPVGQDRTYNGLVPIRLDGAIMQVTWSMDGSGIETQASRCTEHSQYVPNFPERAQLEYLSPANRREQREKQDKAVPQPSPGDFKLGLQNFREELS